MPLCLLLFILSQDRMGQPSECPMTMTQVLKKAQTPGTYRLPQQADFDEGRALFVRTLKGERSRRLVASWKALGFSLHKVGAKPIWALYQTVNEGGGVYFFKESRQYWLLQVPHASYDRNTGRIGLIWLEQGAWRAMAMNSLPRMHPINKQHTADLAHLNRSWFQVFTEAWAEAFPGGTTVQIHGFARAKRKGSARQAAMILSNGSRRTDEQTRTLRNALARVGVGPVLQFGIDTDELGGLTNTQSQFLRAQGALFFHLEMSEVVRARLVKEPDLQNRMLNGLQNGLPRRD